jgi:hypothetical protein
VLSARVIRRTLWGHSRTLAQPSGPGPDARDRASLRRYGHRMRWGKGTPGQWFPFWFGIGLILAALGLFWVWASSWGQIP